MSYKIKSFKNFEKKDWNKLVFTMVGNQHHFTWNRIKYFETLPNIINLSFAVFEGKKCLALVVLGQSKIKNKNIFSFNKDFCPEPIVNQKLSINEKKKLKNNLRTIIENIAKEKNVKLYNLRTHPVIFEKNVVRISSQDQFFQIKWAKNFFVHNTIILNLSMKESEIWNNFSKSHKKNIKRNLSKGLEFNVVNSNTSKAEIDDKFQNFKRAHYLNWNKQTRPDENWESMKNSLIDGEAILFSITNAQKDISFLLCGIHNKFCFGWSQANFKEYEKEYMPRHFLEWSVIKYLKKNGFLLYEIGERYYDYDNFSAPEKFFSISDFKEKFGGSFFPKVNFVSVIK